MRRFYAKSIKASGDTVILSGDEARHIKTVLRMRPGEEVLLINGSGTEYLSIITGISGDTVELIITGRRRSTADPSVHVTLFQCLPKQGKMETIIQKCVELGVYSVVPTSSERCVVKLDGNVEEKLARWNKVSVEAAKQCGRASFPEIAAPVELSSIDFSEYDLILTAYENEKDRTLKRVLKEKNYVQNIAIVIGPEGGFDPKEVDALKEKGAVMISLGRRILRTETAGMAMLAQIL